MSDGQVRCMLLPMASISLVVPNSAVAEIIGYSQPIHLSGSSDWFLGVVLWRGVYLPVVSVDQMCESSGVQVGPRSRIAIVYNPENDDELPYIGLHMQDIPRAYLAEAGKTEAGSDEGLNQYLLSRVDGDEFDRAIPDLDAMIADLKPQITQEKIDNMSL